MGLGRATVLVLVAAACALVSTSAAAQSPTDLAGSWTLNRQLSQFPPEIGFTASFIGAVEPDGGGGGAAGSARGRRRGGAGSAGRFGSGLQPESAEDSQRVRFLTDEVRAPYEHLLIEVTPAMVALTPDRGVPRTVHPGKRDDEVSLGPITAITNAVWEDNRLVITYQAGPGRSLRYTYSITQSPRQLVVDTEFIERDGGDKVRRVYEPATAVDTSADARSGAPAAATPPPASSRTPASTSNAPAAPTAPAVDTRPDAPLRGLTQLGVVVEDLSADATKCGLKRDALESAVTQRLTAAGFRVLRNSDEDTYLYVNVNTVTASASLCVSRYDVTLYSHADGKLSYNASPVLLHVELLHNGGLAGGGPAAHADGVMKGVQQYVDQFVARIQGANR